MMTLQLVIKDFILVKKQALFMLVLAAAIPLFVMSRVPTIPSVIAFIYCVTFVELIIIQAIGAIEGKHPKATALLCATPYSRKSVVLAKYIFFLLLFVYCYAVFSILGLLVPTIGTVSLTVVLSVLLGGIIIYGTFLPFYFKYDFEKTKYFFMVVIFVIAFGSPMLANQLSGVNIDISVLNTMPTATLNIIILLASIAILFISVMLSMRIFSKKEL